MSCSARVALVALAVAVPGACTCDGGGGAACSSSADCPVTDVCTTYRHCEASPAPEFVTNTLPGGAVNAVYSAGLLVHGGTAPYQFALGAGDALPAGLSLAQDGRIGGTPEAAGSTTFSVTVTDDPGRTATATFTIVIR